MHGTLMAQYELGASLGAYQYSIVERKEDHAQATFDQLATPSFNASLFYRERWGKVMNLGVELQFSRKSFDARYGDGGLGGSRGTIAHVDLDLMHLSITPEMRLGGGDNAVLRIGLQIGFKLGGSMTGSSWVIYNGNERNSSYVGASPSDFKGDLRFLFGFGFRHRAVTPWGVTFDPYFSAAIGSILKDPPGAKGTEFGLKMGCSIRRERTPLMKLIDSKMPMPPAGPNW